MLLRTAAAPPPRQGVILLVVLVMLTMFAAVGVAFVSFSEGQANSAKIYKDQQIANRPDPDLLLSYVLNQLVFDTARLDSSLQTHGMLTGVYGTSGNTPFNGVGRLRSTGLDSATFINFQGRAYNETTHGSLNPPYTYTDHNTAWLGALRYDPINVQGQVVERSFVRAARINDASGATIGTFNAYAPTNPNSLTAAQDPTYYRFWQPIDPVTGLVFDTTPYTGINLDYTQRRNMVVRPGPWDHPNFPPPDDFGGDVKNLPPGFRTPVTLGTAQMLVQNDSYWVDVGFPVVTDPSGRRFKPLAAFFIADQDSRLNLNVHGNTQMTVDGSGAPFFNGHASNQGWGPHEVNLNRVLSLAEWQNLFLGSPNNVSSERGKYGRADDITSPIPAALVPTPAFGAQAAPGIYTRPRWFAQTDYDARINVLPGNSVSFNSNTLPRSGILASPGNPFGFPFPLYPLSSANNQIGELLNHPMLAPMLYPYADQLSDRRFGDAHVEALLRHGDTGTDGLHSDTRRILPLSINAPLNRLLLTNRSYDLVRPGKMPYLHRPGAGAYLARAADYANGPNAAEFAQGSRLTFPPDTVTNPPPGAPPPNLVAPGYLPGLGTDYYTYRGSVLGNQFNNWHSVNAHQRVNLNRYLRPYPHLGQGLDPTGANHSTTPLFDLTAAGRRVNPMRYPTAGALAAPSALQLQMAQNDRQQMAREIYMKLLAISGAEVPTYIPDQVLEAPLVPVFLSQMETLRHLAQLAVNIVDYIDDDDVNTPFNFYTLVDAATSPVGRFSPNTLANPAETDPTRQVPLYWVFGTELPRVVLNEVLTEAQVPSGAGTFEVKVWAELHNTTAVRAATPLSPNPPAAYLPVNAAPPGSQAEDSLPISLFVPNDPAAPNGQGYAPYMVVVAATNPGIGTNTMGAPLENLPYNANVTGVTAAPRFQTQPVYNAGNAGQDFSTWAGNPAPNQPRYTSTSRVSGLVGNRAGSRQYMESLASRLPNAGFPYPQNQIDGYFLIGPAYDNTETGGNPNDYYADARDTIHPAAAPGGSGNFLLPQAKANSMPFLNTFSANRGAGAPFMSYQVTKNAGGNWGLPGNASAFNGDRDHGLTVALRRLANPYMPPQTNPAAANYNPYITVDYMPAVPINNIGATFTRTDTEGTGNVIQSRGKRQPYASFITEREQQVPVMNSSMTQQTIGSPNRWNDATGTPTYGNAFDWLVHLDRQLTSPAELLHVSGYRPHELTQRFMDHPVVYHDPNGTALTPGQTDIQLLVPAGGTVNDLRYRGNYLFEWAGTPATVVQVGIGPNAETIQVASAGGTSITLMSGLTRNHPPGSPVIVITAPTTGGDIDLATPLRFNHRAPWLDPLSTFNTLTPAGTPRTNRLHRLFDFLECRTDAVANGHPQIVLQNATAVAGGGAAPVAVSLNQAVGATLNGKTSSGESWRIRPGTTLLVGPGTAQAEVVTVTGVDLQNNAYAAYFQFNHPAGTPVIANYLPPRVLVRVLGSAPLGPTHQDRTRLELSLLHGNCGDDAAHWEIGVGTVLNVLYSGTYEVQAIVEAVTALPSGNFACDVLLPRAPGTGPATVPPPVPPLPAAGVGAINYVAVAPSTNRVPGKINLNTVTHPDIFRALCDAQFCNEFNPIIWTPGPTLPGFSFVSNTQFTIASLTGFSRYPWTDTATGVQWTLAVGTKLELTDTNNGRANVRITAVSPGPAPYTITFVEDRTNLALTWVPTEATTALTVDNVTMMYDRMLLTRDGWVGPDGLPGTSDDLPVRPFQGYASGLTAPANVQFPNGLGLGDTFLRADPVTGSRRLFEVPAALHPQKATEILSKISSHVTPRSNVFAVWITVGFFEVGPDVTLGATAIPAGASTVPVTVSSTFGLRVGQFMVIDRGLATQEVVRIQTILNATQMILDRAHTPPAGRFAHAASTSRLESGLMGEIGRTEGRFQRHRFFAIVDRTVVDPWLLHHRVGDIRALLGNDALDPRKMSNVVIGSVAPQGVIAPGLRTIVVPASIIDRIQVGSRLIIDSGKASEEVVNVLVVVNDPVTGTYTFTAMFANAHPTAVPANPMTIGFPDLPPPVVHWSVIE